MRAGLVLAALILTSAFQTPHGPPAPPTQTITPTQRIDPHQRSPLDPDEAARRLREATGILSVRCRPGGEAVVTLRDVSREGVGSPWRVDVTFVRAARGYAQAPLAAGECAQANAPIPGAGRFVRVYRLLQGPPRPAGYDQRAMLRSLSVAGGRPQLDAESDDPEFAAFLARAATRIAIGGPFAPFNLSIERCVRQCGPRPTESDFYVRDVVES